VKGEGELKILSRLLHPHLDGGSVPGSDDASAAAPPPDNQNHVIIGADSDLLLMALVAGQVWPSPAAAAAVPAPALEHAGKGRRSSYFWEACLRSSGGPS
jgi:hypothetical protein